MKRVIIESPYAGDIERNTRYARAAMRDSLERGEAPLASHLLYTQPGILDEHKPEERQWGIEAGYEWMQQAQCVVVYNDIGTSEGMLMAIGFATSLGIPVLYRQIGFSWERREDGGDEIVREVEEEA